MKRLAERDGGVCGGGAVFGLPIHDKTTSGVPSMGIAPQQNAATTCMVGG